MIGEIERVEGNQVVVSLTDNKLLNQIKDNLRSRNQDIDVHVDDGRHITVQQNKKIHAMIGEISKWNGDFDIATTKSSLKIDFVIEKGMFKSIKVSEFSISEANDFIEFLIVFCLANNVEFRSWLLDEIKGNYGWERHCLDAHKCCICGNHAQYAHWYSVGIGRDRHNVNHIGNYIMALCGVDHFKQHTQGLTTFIQDNHLKGVKITEEIQDQLKLETVKAKEKNSNVSRYEYKRQQSINMYGN